MTGTQRTFWFAHEVKGGFDAMGRAEQAFWASVGPFFQAYQVMDTTMIAATLADGREGFVVGIEYQVDTERLGK